jgi:hypothetical protein
LMLHSACCWSGSLILSCEMGDSSPPCLLRASSSSYVRPSMSILISFLFFLKFQLEVTVVALAVWCLPKLCWLVCS